MSVRFLRGSCDERAKNARQLTTFRFSLVYQPPFASIRGVSDSLALKDLKRNLLRHFAGGDSVCDGFSGDSAEVAHA